MDFHLRLSLAWVLVDPNSSPHVGSAGVISPAPRDYFFLLQKRNLVRNLLQVSRNIHHLPSQVPVDLGSPHQVSIIVNEMTLFSGYVPVHPNTLASPGLPPPRLLTKPPRGASSKTTKLESEPEHQEARSNLSLDTDCQSQSICLILSQSNFDDENL